MKILSANAAAGVDEELVVPAGSLLHLWDQQHPSCREQGLLQNFIPNKKRGNSGTFPQCTAHKQTKIDESTGGPPQ